MNPFNPICGKNIMMHLNVVQDGKSALHYATIFGHTVVLELLLNRGADIHHTDEVREEAVDIVMYPQ